VNKLAVGDSFELPVSFTDEDVRHFAELSGDFNQIHFDREAAERSPIRARAIPGLLGALLFSRILGTQFPGHGTVYVSQSLRFRRPIFVDRPYIASVVVKQIVPGRHRAKVRTTLVDGKSGKIATEGQAWIIHLDRL
jgi:acyl dehydratase